jgi:glycine dehydrogenase subunit 1
MPFVPHTDADISEMLKEIGVEKIEDLFDSIPEEIRMRELDDLPPAASEQEVLADISTLAEQNLPLTGEASFLGGGPMRMYRPAVIQEIIGRTEFITSYTPYQAEISQGLLQAIYEYQTMCSQLLGMEVANASAYDTGTACADALVVVRDNFRGKRRKVLVAGNMHPEIRDVMQTYNSGLELDWVDIPVTDDGRIDGEFVKGNVDKDVAGVFIQYPNRHGVIEDLTDSGLPEVIEAVHEAGSVAVAVTNVIACSVLKSPGEVGFDIAVAEGQPLGLPIGFGGPYLGIFAVKGSFMRKIPGRISGKTVDVDGRTGYVLTLQAREQHIRRERATSNICTSQALCALAASVYLAYYGKVGLPNLAKKIMGMVQQAKKGIAEKTKCEILHAGVPHFNEFAIKCPETASEVNERLLEDGIIGGLALERWGEPSEHMLLGFSDENTPEQVDALIDALASM